MNPNELGYIQSMGSTLDNGGTISMKDMEILTKAVNQNLNIPSKTLNRMSAQKQIAELVGANSPKREVGSARQGDPATIAKYGGDLISPSGQEDLTNVYRKAAQNKPLLDNLVQTIAQTTGARGVTNLKNPNTALDKTVEKRVEGRKYNFEDLNDVVRGRLVYPDEKSLKTGVEEFKKGAEGVGLRVVKTDDYFKNPEKTGYKGYHVDIEFPNGQHSEVQFHTSQSLAASLATHSLRDKVGDNPPENAKDVEKSVNQSVQSLPTPIAEATAQSLEAQNAPAIAQGQQAAMQTAMGGSGINPEVLAAAKMFGGLKGKYGI